MILITGVNGQLGYDFQRLFDEIKEKYIATDVNDLDITDIEKVREFVKDKNISLIINCAAYNNVDKAEDEPEFCKKLNTYAPRDLAIIANKIGADYITYSTDFVFDGKKKTPYTEEDIPNPLSVYGKTKLEGEKEVFKVKPNSFVVRTSWVFGIANNNFNKQVINWSRSKDELSIVDDQISSPTYSKDLAYYSWKLIKTKKYGLYHLSNDGEASKYDQAKYILDKINWQGKLNRAKTKDFNLKAERAEYTKLDSSKLEKIVNKKIPSWQDGIDRYWGEKMEKYTESSYINSIYTLLLFLLLKTKEENEKTFYFFGRGIPKNVAEHFKNSWYLNIRFKSEKGLNKYIKIYSLYKNLEKFIIKENLINKPIYLQGNMSYSQFFLNHMKKCYLIEDGAGGYLFGNENTKVEKKSKKLKILRDKYLKRYKKYYSDPESCEKVEKIYLTGMYEIPEKQKNKAEIINIKEKWEKKSLEEKNEILNIFDINTEKFNMLKQLSNKVLVITQPLSEDGGITQEEKIELYKNIIEQYTNKNIVIKTHPREKTDYNKYFPEALIINDKFPLEIVALLNIGFKEVVTIFSTAAFHFKGVSNVKIVGTEKVGKLKNYFGTVKSIYYKL